MEIVQKAQSPRHERLLVSIQQSSEEGDIGKKTLTRISSLHSLEELPEAVDAGRESTQGLELVDDQRQVAQDVIEGAV